MVMANSVPRATLRLGRTGPQLNGGRGRPARSEPAPAALPEAVTHRAHRGDEIGLLLAKLGPQPADVHVNGPGSAVVLVSPYPRQQHFPGEHLARVGGEELE